MSKIKMIQQTVSKFAGRSGLVMKKHSPEILMVFGVVGVVTSTVLACKATLKAEEVLEKAKNTFDDIKEAKEIAENDASVNYTQNDYQRDMTLAYFRTGVDFIKLYGPAISLGVLSVGCILGSHHILKKRNIAIMAAYKAIETNFSEYRRRVIEEVGVDKDRYYKTGVKTETITVVEEDENGKKVKVKKEVVVQPESLHGSIYAKFFDEFNPNWAKNAEQNLYFLRMQQNTANDLLRARGHVFLNEVYDLLDIPRTTAGAITGWVWNDGGDNFVDFGIYDADKEGARDFVNGYERSILLDFNVDGVIYEKI